MIHSGIVKFYNQEQGFGFIKVPEKRKEFLFHVTGLIDQVTDGDAVTFEIVDTTRGKTAVKIKKS